MELIRLILANTVSCLLQYITPKAKTLYSFMSSILPHNLKQLLPRFLRLCVVFKGT